jgi:hypothetical protein
MVGAQSDTRPQAAFTGGRPARHLRERECAAADGYIFAFRSSISWKLAHCERRIVQLVSCMWYSETGFPGIGNAGLPTTATGSRSMLVQIIFSRHARRRAALYKIPESVVLDILRTRDMAPGIHDFEEKITGIDYPVKIVVVVEHINATVITCYPLKKRRNA